MTRGNTNQSMIQQSLPIKALVARLGSAQMNIWAAYLPDELRDGALKACCAPAKPNRDSKMTKRFASRAGVTGRVWELSRQPHGSREVQEALGAVANDKEAVATLISELHGHIWDASRCPHANHVLQKCISLMRPEDLQFLLDELLVGNLPIQASRHKYGCRIVQQLLEHCSEHQVLPLVDAIMAQACYVARHPFGNYVIQHLLSHAGAQRSQVLCKWLQKDLRALASDPYGGAVLSTAMSVTPSEEKQSLAKSLVQDLSVLASLAGSRHGRPGAMGALEVLHGHDRERAEAVIAHSQETL